MIPQCRYEFIEALVRLAHTKFVRSECSKWVGVMAAVLGLLMKAVRLFPAADASSADAAAGVEMICEMMLLNAESDFDAPKWRREKLWTEKVGIPVIGQCRGSELMGAACLYDALCSATC